MKAVILAGGLGSRLRPFTEIIPKPLLPVGEKSVLEIQIERLKQHGFDEIYLATNYKADYIRNFFGDGSQFGVRIEISKEEEPLGTAGLLSFLLQQLVEHRRPGTFFSGMVARGRRAILSRIRRADFFYQSTVTYRPGDRGVTR